MKEALYTKEKSDYLKNNPTWHAEDSPWKAKQILKMIKKNGIFPETIGEVGCGVGEILNQLHMRLSKHTRFTGFEIAVDAFNLCKLIAKERLEFKNLPLENIDDRFDLLLIIDVFEHVEDYFGFIKSCKEIAKYKIFHIPLDITAHGVLTDKFTFFRNSVGHIHFFTKEIALSTLQDCGYTIIDWFYTPWLGLANNVNSRMLYLPRKILYMMNKDLAVKALGGYSLMVLAE